MTPEDKMKFAMQISRMDTIEALDYLTVCFVGVVSGAPTIEDVNIILREFAINTQIRFTTFLEDKDKMADQTCPVCNRKHKIYSIDMGKSNPCIDCVVELNLITKETKTKH